MRPKTPVVVSCPFARQDHPRLQLGSRSCRLLSCATRNCDAVHARQQLKCGVYHFDPQEGQCLR